MPRSSKKPETIIEEAIVAMLKGKDWFAKSTHGNRFQSGFPDVFATHVRYGHRWIEVKVPGRKGDVFTPAQHEVFPKICASGSGVWVLEGHNDFEYKKLFRPMNWMMYLQVMQPNARLRIKD